MLRTSSATTEAARRWMVAYLKGVRDYADAFRKGLAKDDAVQRLIIHVPLRDPSLFDRMVPIGLDPDGKTNGQSVRDELQWFVDHGLVPQPPDLDRVLDSSYAEYAVSDSARTRAERPSAAPPWRPKRSGDRQGLNREARPALERRRGSYAQELVHPVPRQLLEIQVLDQVHPVLDEAHLVAGVPILGPFRGKSVHQ